jgi:hypothetical protein
MKLHEIKIFESKVSRPYLESKTRTSGLALHHRVGLTTHYNALAAKLLKLIVIQDFGAIFLRNRSSKVYSSLIF